MGSYNGQGCYSNGPKWAEIQMFHDTVLVGRLTLTLGRGGLYPLALFNPSTLYPWKELSPIGNGISYHQHILSHGTSWHLLSQE